MENLKDVDCSNLLNILALLGLFFCFGWFCFLKGSINELTKKNEKMYVNGILLFFIIAIIILILTGQIKPPN